MLPNPPSQPHTPHKSKTPIRFFHWSIIISSSYKKRHNCYFRVFRHTTNISKSCNTCPQSCLTFFSMSHNHIFFHIPPRDDRRTATASPLFRGVRRSRGVCIQKQTPKVLIGNIDKSPRRGVTFINTVQAMNGVATEWEQHRSWRSAVTIVGNQ